MSLAARTVLFGPSSGDVSAASEMLFFFFLIEVFWVPIIVFFTSFSEKHIK